MLYIILHLLPRHDSIFYIHSHFISDILYYINHTYMYCISYIPISCTGNDPPLYTRQPTAVQQQPQQHQQQQQMNNNHYPLQSLPSPNQRSNNNYSINNQQVYQGIPVNGANIKPINGPATFNPPFLNAYPTMSSNQVSTSKIFKKYYCYENYLLLYIIINF